MTKVVATPLVATPDPVGAGVTAVAALRRPASWPEWLGAGSLIAVPVLAAWDPIVDLLGHSPACLVRTTWGVPCPMCGGITAGRALLELDVVDAVAASPLAVLLAAASVVMLVVWVLRMASVVRGPARSSTKTSRVMGATMVAVLALSWVYQCFRS